MATPEVMMSNPNSVTNRMMRPPAITPNYGKKKSMMPKSELPKVVLHDNVTQEQMLQSRLAGIRLDMKRSTRTLELNRKSFIIQQSLKQEQLKTVGIHVKFLPDEVVQTHLTMSKFRSAKSPPPKRGRNDVNSRGGGGNDNKSVKLLPSVARQPSGFVTKIIPEGEFRPPVDAVVPRTASAEEPIRRRDSAKNVNRLTSTLPALRSQSALDPTTPSWRVQSVKHALRKEKTFAHSGEYNRSIQYGVKDPRFVLLQNVLIPSDRPTAGFIQLSPCYNDVLDRYKKNLLRAQRSRQSAGSRESNRRSALVRSAKRTNGAMMVHSIENHEDSSESEDEEDKNG